MTANACEFARSPNQFCADLRRTAGFWPLLNDGEGAVLYCFTFPHPRARVEGRGALLVGCGNVHPD